MCRAVLVSVRNTIHRVEHLAMRCDAREFPMPLDEAEPVVGSWFGVAAMAAHAYPEDGGSPVQRNFRGACAVTVGPERVVGIAAPLLRSGGPAVWFSVRLDGIEVDTARHESGRRAGETKAVVLGGEGWFVGIESVQRRRTPTDRGGKHQERELINALLRKH